MFLFQTFCIKTSRYTIERYKIKVTGKWSACEIETSWGEDRPELPISLRQQREIFWQKRCIDNPELFNGSLVSLLNWSCTEKLNLSLGVTCYRDQLFSNANIAALRRHGNTGFAARALGISAILQTADAQIVLMKRSRYVGEYPGLLDVLGGHIDFENQEKHVHSFMIFDAIKKEICEEAGIKKNEVEVEVCLGLLENCEIDKPELLFYATTALSSSEIQQRSTNAPENFEYDKLIFATANPVKFNTYFQKNRHLFTPSAAGCLDIFQQQIRQ